MRAWHDSALVYHARDSGFDPRNENIYVSPLGKGRQPPKSILAHTSRKIRHSEPALKLYIPYARGN